MALAIAIGTGNAYGENDSSPPLAVVDNTELRIQLFDLDDSDRTDYWVDGAYMLTPKLN